MPNKSTQRSSKARTAKGKSTSQPTDTAASAGGGQASQALIAAGLLLGFAAYTLLFLAQSSSDHRLDSAEGEAGNRFLELLAMQYLLPSFFAIGEGQQYGLLDRFPILLGASIWLAASWAIGRPLIERVLGNETPILRTAMSILTGLAWLSTATLTVGLMGLLHSRWPLLMVALALVAAAFWLHRKSLAEGAPPPSTDSSGETTNSVMANTAIANSVGDRWLLRWIQLSTWGLVACYVLGGMLPPWEFDVVEYHLQAPKEFFQAGEIWMSTHNVYATMPLGVEMHSLAAMTLIGDKDAWWTGGLIGKLVTSLYALLAAATLFGFLERRTGKQFAWLSAGLLLATAGCLHVSLAGLIDIALGAYLLASFLVLAILLPQLRTTGITWQSSLLLGTLAGAAGACKYPGLLLAVAPMIAILVAVQLLPTVHNSQAASEGSSPNANSPAKLLLGISLGLLATCVPWLAKNFILSANPIHPLAASVMDTVGMTSEQIENWRRVHTPQPVGDASPFSLIAAWDSVSQVFWKSPMINPALTFLAVIGAVLAITRTRAKATRGELMAFALSWPSLLVAGCMWTLTTWWFLTHRIDRFWLPMLPLAAGLAGYALHRMTNGNENTSGRNNAESSWISTAVLLIAAFGSAYGLLQGLTGLAQVDNRYFISLKSLREEAGLSRSIAWINANLDAENDRILCIGEAKMFHFLPEVDYATCFNRHDVAEFLAEEDPQRQMRTLNLFEISHVLVNWNEIERYRAPGNYGFSDFPQRSDIASMVESRVLEPMVTSIEDPNIQLFRVLPEPLNQENSK